MTPRLTPYSVPQLLNLVVGLVGIQFAWSMQISLTNQVVEPLGADPFIKGLIWCAGPLTGILVQPIVGAFSDNTWTRLGRRRPFLLVGALLGALALIAFPHSPTLLAAAALIWVIDASVNISQGPYRALVPDNLPPAQTTIANSYMNAAIAVGSVISLGLPPLLASLGFQMSIAQQFLMASIALVLTILYTCFTIRETRPVAVNAATDTQLTVAAGPTTWLGSLKDFAQSDREVFKLCGVQFLTWIGVMCFFMNSTDFVVHNVYHLPELTQSALNQSPQLTALKQQAVNSAQLGLAAFNGSSFLLTIPLGYLAGRLGRKRVHSIALLCMAAALAVSPFVETPVQAIAMMALAGIAWGTILSIPFSILADYIPAGKEGSVMGIFNMFVASPQLISATVVSALVGSLSLTTPLGNTHPYFVALLIGSGSLVLAVVLLQFLQEKSSSPSPVS